MARTRTISNEDILQRARPVFVARGIHAKTRDVAAAVGLTWGALALRFGSKRALFELAMAQRPEPESDAAHDLDSTLRRLRSEIAQRWPISMQLRLSSAGGEPDIHVPWLPAALQALVDRGQIRAGLPMQGLAALLLAAFTGAAAERFLAPARHEPGDDALIEALLQLLS
ncbi:helix-turn-helix domain-containing protein [Roseateles sp. P5_D6]